MGLSIKWTFENEPIFYAGEKFIIYLTLSCTVEEPPQPVVSAITQPSFLSSMFGIFSSSNSPKIQSAPAVTAENSRRKSTIFYPKPQKALERIQGSVLPENDAGIEDQPLKIELSQLNISINEPLEEAIMSDLSGTFPVDNLREMLNSRRKPPLHNPLSVTSHPESNISQDGGGLTDENSKSKVEEIAWVFAQMQGNFMADVSISIGFITRIQL